jgi:hypothetical protein
MPPSWWKEVVVLKRLPRHRLLLDADDKNHIMKELYYTAKKAN